MKYSVKYAHRLELRVTKDQLKRWRVTAAIKDMKLSEWIRSVLNEGAIP